MNTSLFCNNLDYVTLTPIFLPIDPPNPQTKAIETKVITGALLKVNLLANSVHFVYSFFSF